MGNVKARNLVGLLAIYSLIFLSNGTMLLSPAMDTLVASFPDAPYGKVLLTYTLPSLVALPFTMLSGSVVGRRLRYRTMLLTVVPCYLISGIGPVLANTLDGVLACRAVYGACIGMIAPQGNALILRTFQTEERYRYLGYSNIVVGIAGVAFQMLGGYLCVYGWRAIFLGYTVAVIPLLLIWVGLKEPAPVERAEEEKRRQIHIPKESVMLFLLVAALYICSQSKMLTLSSIVASEGIGDSKTSAAILSVATVGAVLAGVVFPWFCRKVKRYRIPILVGVLAATTICNLINSPTVIAVGYGIGTTAFMMNLNLMTLRASRIYGTERSGQATGLIQLGDKCGCFLATYFTTAAVWAADMAGAPFSKYKAPVVACVIVYTVAAVLDIKRYGADVTESVTK